MNASQNPIQILGYQISLNKSPTLSSSSFEDLRGPVCRAGFTTPCRHLSTQRRRLPRVRGREGESERAGRRFDRDGLYLLIVLSMLSRQSWDRDGNWMILHQKFTSIRRSIKLWNEDLQYCKQEVKKLLTQFVFNLQAADSSPVLHSSLPGFSTSLDFASSLMIWRRACVCACLCVCVCLIASACLLANSCTNTTQTIMALIKRHVILMERANLANTHTHTQLRHHIWIHEEKKMCVEK